MVSRAARHARTRSVAEGVQMKARCILLAMAALAAPAPAASAGSCYADPIRLGNAMAIIVASRAGPGYAHALYGKALDLFMKHATVIDQSTGGCGRERTLATTAADDRLLASPIAFCAEVEAALASDATLAQALIEAGVRMAP